MRCLLIGIAVFAALAGCAPQVMETCSGGTPSYSPEGKLVYCVGGEVP